MEIGAELGEANVSDKHLDAWVAECGSVAVYDLVVSTAGPLADVVERILDAYGTPVHEQELLVDLDQAGLSLPAGALAVKPSPSLADSKVSCGAVAPREPAGSRDCSWCEATASAPRRWRQ